MWPASPPPFLLLALSSTLLPLAPKVCLDSLGLINLSYFLEESSSFSVVPAANADVVISNEYVELTFSGTNGLLSSWLHKPSNLRSHFT